MGKSDLEHYYRMLAAIAEQQRKMLIPLRHADRAARDLAKQIALYERIGRNTAGSLAALNVAVANTALRPLVAIADQMVRFYEAPTRAAMASVAPLLEIQRRLERTVALRQYPSLKATLSEWQRAAAAGPDSGAFATEVVSGLGDAIEADDDAQYEVALKCIEQAVARAAQSSLGVRVAYQVLLPLILFLLSFLLTHTVATRADKEQSRRLGRLEKTQDRLVTSVEALADALPESVEFLRCLRATRLRKGPSVESQIVRALEPGTLMAVLGRRGRWLRVEVFNSVNATGEVGWVYKRYLVESALPEVKRGAL